MHSPAVARARRPTDTADPVQLSLDGEGRLYIDKDEVTEAALPQPGDAQSLLLPHDGWRRMRDLYRAAQARNPSHAPRAPPQRA